MLLASGWRRQAREEAATATREKKTMSLDGVGEKVKVSNGALTVDNTNFLCGSAQVCLYGQPFLHSKGTFEF